MDPVTAATIFVATAGAIACRWFADWVIRDDDDGDEKEALRAKVSELALQLERERNERRERDQSLLGEAPREHVPSPETGDAVAPWGTPPSAAPEPAKERRPSWDEFNDPAWQTEALKGAQKAAREARRAARESAEELSRLRMRLAEMRVDIEDVAPYDRFVEVGTFGSAQTFKIPIGTDPGVTLGLPPMSEALKRPYLRTDPDTKGNKGKRTHHITFDLPASEAIDDRPDQVAIELCAATARTMSRGLLPGSITRESQVVAQGRMRYTYGFYTTPRI